MTTTEPKKLYRSTTDRIIAGVAGGLAEYFEIDSTLVRFIFVALAFLGAGIALYIIGWLIIPTRKNPSFIHQVTSHKEEAEEAGEEIRQEVEDAWERMRVGNWYSGSWLIGLGIVLLLINFGWIELNNILRLWPLILIIFGWQLINRHNR